jgi:hypothetical protein
MMDYGFKKISYLVHSLKFILNCPLPTLRRAMS